MNQKRIWLKVLISLAILLLGFKIYLEIDSNIYEKKIEEMNNHNFSNTKTEHKTLSQNGYDIHYYVSGKENNETILFLHPAFTDHKAFDFQVDFFSEKYKVITIDLLGHGLSKAKKSKDKIDTSVKHISKILKNENITSVHIIGVSMGTLIAQYFAIKNPEKVKTLTSLGGYDINEEHKEVAKAQQSEMFGLMFRAIFSMKAFRKKASLISAFTEKGQAQFYKSGSLYTRKSLMVMSGLQNIVKNREDIQAKYPTLILAGEHDIDLAIKLSKDWHNKLTNSKFEIIKGAGHCANMDEPNKFNKIVMEFITNN